MNLNEIFGVKNRKKENQKLFLLKRGKVAKKDLPGGFQGPKADRPGERTVQVALGRAFRKLKDRRVELERKRLGKFRQGLEDDISVPKCSRVSGHKGNIGKG